ncbi:MAG: NAD(P)/FAD-dependent oxidoreductase [Candidatus Krumholzibacteriia bacterium]
MATANRLETRDRRPVLVVGGGLAGLAGAVHLHRAGLPVLVLEAADAVGGRVRTDLVDGHRLDRGFQVLLTAYPEVKSQLDLAALEPCAFRPGALVRHRGGFERLSDPFRDPAHAFTTLAAPVGSIGDKLRMARFRWSVSRGTPADQLAGPDHSTVEELRRLGFGEAMIEAFFRPFLGGIFLDPGLATSSRMLRFVFRMFASGRAVVPREGMEAVPRQLARRLPPGAVRTGAEVTEVHPRRVVLRSGEVMDAAAVIVATDGSSAARLLPAADGVAAPHWCGATCLYFSADGPAPVGEPVLILGDRQEGPINNLCFPSVVSPDLAPPGRMLASVTVIGGQQERDDLIGAVREQLGEWFGESVRHWLLLRTYFIRQALPEQEPGWLEPPARPVRLPSGLYVAGDHRETSSSNGALAAGRRAAAAVLEELGKAPAVPQPD